MISLSSAWRSDTSATKPWTHTLTVLRKVQARATASPFQIPQERHSTIAILPLYGRHEKVPLLKATVTKDYLQVLYEAKNNHNQFSHRDKCSSPPNKSQVQAPLPQGQGKFSHRRNFIRLTRSTCAPHALPRQGWHAITCISDGCPRSLPGPIFPWCLQ